MLNAFHVLIFLLNISVAKTPIAKIIPKIDEAQTLYAECQLTGVVSYNAFKESLDGFQKFHPVKFANDAKLICHNAEKYYRHHAVFFDTLARPRG